MKKVIVVIGGLVGAGKTSLVSELSKYYMRLHRRVCVSRLTAYPNISYIFFNLLARTLYGSRVVKDYERVGIHPSTLVAKRLRTLPHLPALIVVFAEILSLLLWNLYMKLKCSWSQVVIVDEGFINAVANYLEILGRNAATLVSFVLRTAQKWSRRHRVIPVFVVVDFETLIKRWFMRGRPIITSIIDLSQHIRYLKLMLISLRLFQSSGFHVAILDSSSKDVHTLMHEAIRCIEGNV